MKKSGKKYILAAFFLTALPALQAQEAENGKEPIEPVMELAFLKATDGKIHLTATLVNYVDRNPIPLPGLEVIFKAGYDPEIELGRSITEDKGKALLVLEEDPALPGFEEGEVVYRSEFEGTDDIISAEAEVSVTPVTLEMKFSMVDSVGYVKLKAYTMDGGEKVPVADEDVYVYVKRMFSDLPIGEDFLDENGEFEVEVPGDLPGNAVGDIEIIGRFNDHYMFGTVEKRETVRWGVPTQHKVPAAQRTLWTQIAPLWMIITLTIMLGGVWGHYTFVIISLFRIKRENRKAAA